MNRIFDMNMVAQGKDIISPVAKHDVSKGSHPILDLQEKIGNQWVLKQTEGCSLFLQRCPTGGLCHICPASEVDSMQNTIQPKLKIGKLGDKYEQEADRIAEQVMNMPEQIIQPKSKCPLGSPCKEEKEDIQMKPISEQITPLVQRQPEEEVPEKEEEEPEEEEEEERSIQTKLAGGEDPHVSSGLEAQIRSLRGGGQLLPQSVRNFFEPRFGYDFSGVRVHTGAKAAGLAWVLNSQAFTIGRDMVFGTGQYKPETIQGNKLLAHELTHVVQQKGNQFQRKLTIGQHWDEYGQKTNHAQTFIRSYSKSRKTLSDLSTSPKSGRNVQSVAALKHRYPAMSQVIQANITGSIFNISSIPSSGFRAKIGMGAIIQRQAGKTKLPLTGLFEKPPKPTKEEKSRTLWYELEDKEIEDAIIFNSKLYDTRSTTIIANQVGIDKTKFDKEFIFKIAKWQQSMKNLRVDGQVGEFTLRRMVNRMLESTHFDNINDAIWLVVDGLGFRVHRIKSIVYNQSLSSYTRILSDGVSIQIGRPSVKNYRTLKYYLRIAIKEVQEGVKSEPVISPDKIPEKELLRLVDKLWERIPASYDPDRDKESGFGPYWTFRPRYKGVLVDKKTKKKMVDIKQECKTWWMPREIDIYKKRKKYKFHLEGRALVSIGCYDRKRKVFVSDCNPILERRWGNWIDKVITTNYIRASCYCLSQKDIDKEKEKHERPEILKYLHETRLKDACAWKDPYQNEYDNYNRYFDITKEGKLWISTAKWLETRKFTGLKVPYQGDPHGHLYPICCTPIKDKDGNIVVKSKPYDELLRHLIKLKGMMEAKNPKEFVKRLLKKYPRNKINPDFDTYMRKALKWWSEGLTPKPGSDGVPWDAYIDGKVAMGWRCLKELKVIPYKRLELTEYIRNEAKVGKSDDYMFGRLGWLHIVMLYHLRRVGIFAATCPSKDRNAVDDLGDWYREQDKKGKTLTHAYRNYIKGLYPSK